MNNWLLLSVAIIYLGVVVALFAYGINFFYLTYRTWRDRNSQDLCAPLVDLPRVTVQLPIYNEQYVAERLIDAAARQDYPLDLLEIQVLDDSTDETVSIVRHAVERWRTRGIAITQLRRKNRAGFKAGALAYGLSHARGEFIAIFDADFLPASDFLRQTLPHFNDPQVAFIQTRWGHVNRDYSFLTWLQSLAIDAHFMVEQFARSRAGYWFNFNGTAGVWRRSALEDAGGWTADTLTEDLDLSYRAALRGWRALYLRNVVVPSELPVSFSAYRRQQYRWARGSFECAIKLLPQVWQARVALPKKIQATLHLTGYTVHLLLFALTILYPIILTLSMRFPELASWFGIVFVLNVTAFAPTFLFVVAQQQIGKDWWRALPAILFMTVLGAGMMANTARAALGIVFKRAGVFERTPKFGIIQKEDGWHTRRYQLAVDPIVLPEILFALLNTWTTWLALQTNNWAIAVYSAIFCAGLLFTSGITILQSVAIYWHQRIPSGDQSPV